MGAPVVLVLVSGLMTVGFGTFALILGWNEDGLPQLMIRAVAPGLVLVG
jgi:peptidase E